MTVERCPDFVVGRRLLLVEEGGEGHQDPRSAEAALESMLFMERLLKRAQRFGLGRQALDCFDVCPVGFRREHQARANGLSVDEHGAGPADTVLAADVRAGQAELMPEEVGEEQTWLDIGIMLDAVDG
jgi:hypothetical protein